MASTSPKAGDFNKRKNPYLNPGNWVMEQEMLSVEQKNPKLQMFEEMEKDNAGGVTFSESQTKDQAATTFPESRPKDQTATTFAESDSSKRTS